MTVYVPHKQGYFLQDNTKGIHSGFAIMLNPNGIHEIANCYIFSKSPEKNTTIIMNPHSFVIKKTIIAEMGKEYEAVTTITDFDVTGDCADIIRPELERIKEALYGEVYIAAKNKYLQNVKEKVD